MKKFAKVTLAFALMAGTLGVSMSGCEKKEEPAKTAAPAPEKK